MSCENRESNFELLRIIAMFLIVLSHVVLYSVKRGDWINWEGYGVWKTLQQVKILTIQIVSIGGGGRCSSFLYVDRIF